MAFDIKYKRGTLELFDKIERKVFRIQTPKWSFTKQTYAFRYPVDEIFSGRCRRLSHGIYLTFIRREADYEAVEEIVPGQEFHLKRDRYIIEINAHIKVYAFVDSPIKVKSNSRKIELDFNGEREIIFGVRSFHRRPSATITATKALQDLAEAISLLSSSMKTTTSERSYPTLRGHPPLIQIGDNLSIPEGIEKPDSGVVVSLPEKLTYLYVASPLIYYLMADVEFGRPAIYCDSGFEYTFSTRFPKFENQVAEALQRVFFMDCLVRCAGSYLRELKELEAIQGLGLDIRDLFSKKVSEQLPVYFDIPWERIERYMPEWHLSYYVKPALHRITAIPFILNELALIRLPRSTKVSMKEVAKSTLKDFFRGDPFQIMEEKRITKPLLGRSQNHVWLSSETPIGIAKAEEDAFFNQLKYLDREKDEIEIALVLNDKKMLKEKKLVQKVYRQRKDIPLKIEIFEFLDRDGLVDVFARGYDLVHYIGHCDERGLVCSNGGLKTKDLEKNNTPLFFLNACNSYDEGVGLLRTGSVGGVVTVQRVVNEEALKIGYAFSRLLSNGFPLGKAMELARMKSLYGQDYLILGNSGYSLTQHRDYFVPFYYELKEKEGNFLLTFHTLYYTIGGFIRPYIEGHKENYLHFTKPTFKLSYLDLKKLAKTDSHIPVIFRNKLHWMGEFENIA
jgi:hypothetical protein